MDAIGFNDARRGFLIRCCQALGLCLLPRLQAPLFAAPDYHLHPHYRDQLPLETVKEKVDPRLDAFATEQHHAEMANVLDAWAADLLNLSALQRALHEDFRGSSWQATDTDSLPSPLSVITIERLRFRGDTLLPKSAFLADLGKHLSVFTGILTAELQITSINSDLSTAVRYEIVGVGPGFEREQHTGVWQFSWKERRISQWQLSEETRARSSVRLFSDIAAAAFGSNHSYAAQFLHGIDDWRAVLDGACGIDIYGHNGVSVADVYGAGHDDVYVCQPAGLPNRLYRNLGDGTFQDVTAEAGVGVLDNTACALFADFRNKGLQDLVVVCASGPILFINEGNGVFRRQDNAFQFTKPPQGTFTGAAAADYDGDGYLDICFCLYSYYQGAGQYRYPTPYYAAENGPPNFLMRNNGQGFFRDVTAAAGLDQNNSRFSFCCAWNDFNRDGHPDLYVVNDFGRKNLYRNNGDGTFTDIAADAQVEDIGAGMSACWFDYNNDAAPDLYVANMWTAAGERISHDAAFQTGAPSATLAFYQKHAMGNSLFQGEHFQNVTRTTNTSNGRWSWSSDSWDFNHDGNDDIYVTNGMVSGSIKPDLNSFFWRQVIAKSPNAPESSKNYEQGWNAINELIREGQSWSGYERNVLFANHGDGTFTDIAGALGIDFPEDGRSFARADFDGDGREELLIKSRNAPQLRFLKNVVPELPSSVVFRLRGVKSNRDAIGAVISIKTSVGSQTKSVQAGSGFLSQHSKSICFGLGKNQGHIAATIVWPSGFVQHLSDLPPGNTIVVEEGSSHPLLTPFRSVRPQSVATPMPAAAPLREETWLLAPVKAPGGSNGKPHLITLDQTVTNQDLLATYNLLYRYLFDFHRDMTLPTSFLLDDQGQIVKIYQGSVSEEAAARDLARIPTTENQRLEKALPFPGVGGSYNYGRNYLSLGAIFFQRGYYEPALEFFLSALKDNAASAEAVYGAGSVYLKQQQKSKAQQYFEQATRMNAAYPETTTNAWNNLGLLAAQGGDSGKAIACFQQVLKLDAGHFIALLNLGNAYRQERRWPDARQALEQALKISPDDAEANYGLGMVFAQTGDTERTYHLLNKALTERPAYPEALNNLGILYLRTGRPEPAIAKFQECIRAAPSFDQAYLNLAQVYSIQGEAGKAKTTLQDLLAQSPHHQRALEMLQQMEQPR